MKAVVWVALVYVVVCAPVVAQQSNPGAPADTAAMEQKLRDLEDRVIALEGQLRQLKSAQAQPSPAAGQQQAATAAQTEAQAPASIPAPAQPPSSELPQSAGEASTGGQLPVYGGASAAAKALNPDISMIGDFIGAVGGNSAPPLATAQPFPALQMHESELGVQAIIDAYARR